MIQKYGPPALCFAFAAFQAWVAVAGTDSTLIAACAAWNIAAFSIIGAWMLRREGE